MNIHEWQAKKLLKKFGFPVPEGDVASTPEKAKKIAEKLGGNLFAVKAQIHAGGRGKAGGIKIAHSPDEVYQYAKELLGKKLVTYQTGPEGKPVKKVLVEKGAKIKKEMYLGVTLDRSKEKVAVIASPMGGVEIEEVAREHPEAVLTEYVDTFLGLPDWKARKIAKFLGGEVSPQYIKALVKMYFELDLMLIEINPFALTDDGPVALDCKIVVDDNGLFRHPDLAKLYDPSQDDPREVRAKKAGVAYVGLDGNIGCLVNGAGLAMATMDVIKLAGGEPANFLDVGGGASEEQVRTALSIILSDRRVKSVFINIFGGIMRCDTVANALVKVVSEMKPRVPIVVRLEGTNVELGRQIIKDFETKGKEIGVQIFWAENMWDGAQKAVQLANQK